MSSEGLHYRVYVQECDKEYQKFKTYPGAIEYLMASLKPAVDSDAEVDDDFYLVEIKNRIKRCELIFVEKQIGSGTVSVGESKRKYTLKNRKEKSGIQSRIMSLIEGAGRKGIHTSRIMLELCHNEDFSVTGTYVYQILSDLKKLEKIYCAKKMYMIKG